MTYKSCEWIDKINFTFSLLWDSYEINILLYSDYYISVVEKIWLLFDYNQLIKPKAMLLKGYGIYQLNIFT